VLTRALGTDREIKPDVRAIDWRPGDRLLFCSDGLSGLVEKSMILATLGLNGETLEQIADRLVEMALDAGGDDNVTVVLVADDEANAAGGESA
jgi:serine/threonine protein phosphatase PrpC